MNFAFVLGLFEKVKSSLQMYQYFLLPFLRVLIMNLFIYKYHLILAKVLKNYKGASKSSDQVTFNDATFLRADEE